MGRVKEAVKGPAATDRDVAMMQRAGAPASLVQLVSSELDWLATLSVSPVQEVTGSRTYEDHERHMVQVQARRASSERVAAALKAATVPQQQAALARALAHTAVTPTSWTSMYQSLEETVYVTLRARRLPWTAEELAWMLGVLTTVPANSSWWFPRPGSCVLTAVEKAPADVRAQLGEPLTAVVAHVSAATTRYTDMEKLLARARLLADAAAGGQDDTIPDGVLPGDDDFGPAAVQTLLAEFPRPGVARTLRHLSAYGTAMIPPRKWTVATQELLTAVPAAADISARLLTLAAEHHETERAVDYSGHTFLERVFVASSTIPVLRGAVWTTAAKPTDSTASVLADVAAHCGIGLGGSGGVSRCPSVTSSALAALSSLPPDAVDATARVAALSRVRSKVKNRNLLAAVDKALDAVAQASGLTPGQLLERAVPDLGLRSDGTLELTAGDYTATATLEHGPAGAKVATTWQGPSGRPSKSTPAKVRSEHPDVVARLRELGAEAKKVAAVQRTRLEDLMVEDRSWSGTDWAAWYVAHPVVGLYARDLIWQVQDGTEWFSGLPHPTAGGAGALEAADGQVRAVAAGDVVRLWHPQREPLPEVKAWRARLTDAARTQPFKQAFRELYLLTPAEEQTGTYSNRFAAHVVRYPQFGALLRARGWAGNHLGYWDGGYEGTATRTLADTGWRASFYYQLVELPDDHYERVSLASTDQVRFERLEDGTWRAQPLIDVPALLFSEAMRDVDLFVGVTSVAADPTWGDNGPERYRAYWHDTSFGDLTETAQVRKDALERLLPRTKLATVATVEGNFLRVRGSIREYRIHLGSTNILMSPADTYLCIVPARGAKDPNVYLPFEDGGGKLSVILSKAFLLAADDKITDPTITHQLRSGL